MKKKILHRIAVTVIGVPLVFAAIFFFPHYHFALFFLVVLFFSLSGSIEMRGILEQKFQISIRIPPWVGLALPVTAYVSLFVYPSFSVIWTVYIFLLLAVFSAEIFFGAQDKFENSLTRSVMTLFMLCYPNLFTPFVIYLGSFEHASFLYVFFFLLVFSNDVFAYVFGMVLGKTTRGVVKASPNKSLTGFLGGTIMTMAIAAGYSLAFRSYLPPAQWWHMAILGALMSLASNLGDLFESVLKRSAQVKDSGNLMPGRGGILDSIDSIIFGAPVFYYLVYLWYLAA